MSFTSNLDFLYNHLPMRFRTADAQRGRFLYRFLKFYGDTLDDWDQRYETFDMEIAPETASEEFIDYWLAAIFDWGYFPSWYTLARKRQFYAAIFGLYARRGTRRGIEELLRFFSVNARVTNAPQIAGEMVLGEDRWMVTSPLVLVVEVLSVRDEVNFDCIPLGEQGLGECVIRSTWQTLSKSEIEALIRFEQPLSQTVIVDYPVPLRVERSYEYTQPSAPAHVPAFTSSAEDLFVEFDASGMSVPGGGQAVEWEWHFGDEQYASGATVSHLYTLAGRYWVAVTARDTQGQSWKFVEPVTVTEFVPSMIPNLVGQFDADAITGRDEGEALPTWENLSAGGIDAEQTDAGAMALFRLHRTPTGLPALAFDQADDYYEMQDPVTVGTVFVVARANYAAFPFFLGLVNGTANDNENLIFTGFSGTNEWLNLGAWWTHYINGEHRDIPTTTPALDQWNIYSARAGFFAMAFGGFVIGRDRSISGRSFNGDIATVWLFSRILTDAEMLRVHRALSVRQGIPLVT